MNRFVKSGLAIAACMGAAVVGGVAYADPTTSMNVTDVPWIGMADCGTGAIAGHHVVDTPSGRELQLTGEAQSCPPDTSAPFQRTVAVGIIAYNAWGGYLVGTTQLGSPGSTFAIDAAVRLGDDRPDRRIWAVCLAGSWNHRLSCLSVDPPDGPPLGAALGVDDPIVSVGSGPEAGRPGGIVGYCGGCVGWPVEG